MANTPAPVRDVEEAQPADAFIHYDHIGHGSSPASWTVSITLILASVVAAIGFVIPMWSLAYIGAAMVPLALILGIVLKKMGFGVEMDSAEVIRRGPDAYSDNH